MFLLALTLGLGVYLVSCPTSNCHMYALPCEVSLLPEIPRWAWVDRRRSWS
jgi:hypothetical protein